MPSRPLQPGCKEGCHRCIRHAAKKSDTAGFAATLKKIQPGRNAVKTASTWMQRSLTRSRPPCFEEDRFSRCKE
jgi:hypothetical protein